MTFVKIATSVRNTANRMICVVMAGSSTLSPMLAKNTGDRSKYDSVSNLDVRYWDFCVLEIITPAM